MFKEHVYMAQLIGNNDVTIVPLKSNGEYYAHIYFKYKNNYRFSMEMYLDDILIENITRIDPQNFETSVGGSRYFSGYLINVTNTSNLKLHITEQHHIEYMELTIFHNLPLFSKILLRDMGIIVLNLVLGLFLFDYLTYTKKDNRVPECEKKKWDTLNEQDTKGFPFQNIRCQHY